MPPGSHGRPSRAPAGGATRGGRPSGESRNSASASSADATLTTAAVRNEGVHPAAASTAAKPTADSTNPSWLTGPVALVSAALRSGGNHAGTSRMTLMNTSASPIPSTTRAANAAGRAEANANVVCAPAMTSSPRTISRRDPYRSISTPTGTWSAAYTSSCTMENAARVAAVIPKRASASVVATPSDERCSTAITAANCPTVNTSHAVRPPRAGRGADRSEAGWLGVGLTTAPKYPPPPPPPPQLSRGVGASPAAWRAGPSSAGAGG